MLGPEASLRLGLRVPRKDLLDALDLALVSGPRLDLAVDPRADADVGRDPGCAHCVHGGVAVVHRLGHLGPRSFCRHIEHRDMSMSVVSLLRAGAGRGLTDVRAVAAGCR